MHRLLTIAALVLSVGISSAEAAKRVALVIGNNSYKTLPDLNNARTDARGMAAKLKELGWSVILKQDASRRDISRSLADFEGRLKDAEVGLVFYAGHGIQKNGTNYLVPSNAQIEIEEDLRLEGVDAGEFLNTMERAGAPLNIVILDACRDNPLPKRSRSGARGLSAPAIPKGIKGTAIFYSAAPGQVAQDGPSGGHGVFTGELLKVLDQPGLKLEEVFKQTATKVAAVTNGSQDPWINSSVKGDFYFRDGQKPIKHLHKDNKKSDNSNLEAAFWSSIQGSENPADYEDYLLQFKNGIFTRLAQRRVKELRRQQAEARTSLEVPSASDSEIEFTTFQRSIVRGLLKAEKIDFDTADEYVKKTAVALLKSASRMMNDFDVVPQNERIPSYRLIMTKNNCHREMREVEITENLEAVCGCFTDSLQNYFPLSAWNKHIKTGKMVSSDTLPENLKSIFKLSTLKCLGKYF